MESWETLAARAVAGDREALAALFVSVHADVWRFMLRHCDSAADAEDATQETFVQALRALPTLRQPGAFRGWLFRIAIRVIGALREGRRLRRKLEGDVARNAEVREAAMPAEKEDVRRAVRAAVERLEPELRTAVALRYEQGLSYGEIAEATEAPEGTVAARLHAAHERLRHALAGVGIALAMAALERELSAAPADPVPERLATRIRTLADSRPSRAGGSRRLRWPAGAAALAVLLAAGLLLRFRVGMMSESSRELSGAGAGVARDSKPAETGRDTAFAPGEARTEEPDRPPPTAAADGVVSGRVLDAATGRPLPGSRVQLLSHGSPRPPSKTVTDADGAFSFRAPPGRYALIPECQGFPGPELENFVLYMKKSFTPRGEGKGITWEDMYPPEHLVTLAAGSELTRDLRIGLRAFTPVELSGTVVDETGLPVESAVVRIERHGVTGERLEGCPVPVTLSIGIGDLAGQQVTDALGRFSFHCVFPLGTAELTARAPGYRVTREPVEMSQRPATVVLRLAPGLDVAGVVVDSLGSPVAGARLWIGGAPNEWSDAPLEPAQATVHADGNFRLDDVDEGARVLAAWAPGYGVAAVRIGANTGPIRLVLPPARETVRGVVRTAAGEPVAGADVVVTQIFHEDEDLKACIRWMQEFGHPICLFQGGYCALLERVESPRTTTAADGTFELQGLPLTPGHTAVLAARKHGLDTIIHRVRDTSWVDMRFEDPEEVKRRLREALGK